MEREEMVKQVKELEEYISCFYAESPEDEEVLKRLKDKIHVMKWAIHGRY